MKLILMLLITSAAFGQFGRFGQNLNGNDQHTVWRDANGNVVSRDSGKAVSGYDVKAEHKLILIYTKPERSPYMSYPEGGGPYVDTQYFEWFTTAKDAVAYLEDNPDYTYIGLFEPLSSQTVKVIESQVSEPQAPKIKTVHTYTIESKSR